MMNRTALPTETPPGRATRRFRGPFARWPRAADAVLAAFVTVTTTLFQDAPGDAVVVRAIGDVAPAALLVFAVAGTALWWRRTAPVAVLGTAVTGWALTLGSGFSDLGGITIVALYSAGRYAAHDGRVGLGVAAALAVVTADGLIDALPWGEIGFGALVLFVAWYTGRRLRLRQERAAQFRREQAAEANRIVAEERTHIARELHDVVAHRVSMMTVQAGAARMVAPDDPESALQAMAAVEEAGRQALDELRHLLGVLRPDGEHGGLGPQPALTDLPALVEQMREAGLDVSLGGDSRIPLPARVELSVYRIVQEALTNVLKHCGPRARTQVYVRSDGNGDVTVEIVDDGRGPAAPPAPGGHGVGAGHGIVGMRERALLLGGSLDAGPRPGGGFRVLARLPAGGESA
ncbi:MULTISPECIES: sensor histidine kinase [unclassified Streptomyces]|uniref:sensor histidine kinase n=1 Tax=unclassified Streptomyces TaxID=2593676 RepID=UPI001F035590|nr:MULTISPECIES: histidine kinase [unclassified Streptomyces]